MSTTITTADVAMGDATVSDCVLNLNGQWMLRKYENVNGIETIDLERRILGATAVSREIQASSHSGAASPEVDDGADLSDHSSQAARGQRTHSNADQDTEGANTTMSQSSQAPKKKPSKTPANKQSILNKLENRLLNRELNGDEDLSRFLPTKNKVPKDTEPSASESDEEGSLPFSPPKSKSRSVLAKTKRGQTAARKGKEVLATEELPEDGKYFKYLKSKEEPKGIYDPGMPLIIEGSRRSSQPVSKLPESGSTSRKRKATTDTVENEGQTQDEEPNSTAAKRGKGRLAKASTLRKGFYSKAGIQAVKKARKLPPPVETISDDEEDETVPLKKQKVTGRKRKRLASEEKSDAEGEEDEEEVVEAEDNEMEDD